MEGPPFDERVAQVASKQFGAFSRRQAKSCGATRHMVRRRVDAGRWEAMNAHVFRIAGSPSSWEQDLIAATLGWGQGSVVSHRTAGALRGLPGLTAGIVELTVPRSRRWPGGPGIVHRNRLERRHVTSFGPFRVTTVERTLLDVASVVPLTVVEEALDDALLRGQVSLRRIQRLLDEVEGGRPGARVMRSLVAERSGKGRAESVLETKAVRLIRLARLPEPVIQYRVRSGGRTVARVDLAYPNERLAIELDGRRWHARASRFERDIARRNRLTLLGWRIIHATWSDVTQRSEQFVEAVRSGLFDQ